MTTLKRRVFVPLAIAGACAVGLVLDSRPALADDAQMNETRARMRGFFVTLTGVYQYTLDEKAFEDPDNYERVLRSLQALAKSADDLEAHTGELDPSFDYLKRSLARDARGAAERYEIGQFVGARWVLNRLTENCVTCHSKLPAERSFDLGAEFLEEVGAAELPPATRVDLEVASRQFETALETYEAMFRDPKMTDRTLALTGAFGGYLRICIGVRNDVGRPKRTFEAFLERDDLSENTRRLVRGWIEALDDIRLDTRKGNELSPARKLVKGAREDSRFPGDRTHLVEFVTGAALLHRYLEGRPTKSEDAAEAYYLLGVAESYISRSYWISETGALLEQSIRTAPKSAAAKDAYAFLVDYTISGHQVTARGVPENVEETLDELRKLIEE